MQFGGTFAVHMITVIRIHVNRYVRSMVISTQCDLTCACTAVCMAQTHMSRKTYTHTYMLSVCAGSNTVVSNLNIYCVYIYIYIQRETCIRA